MTKKRWNAEDGCYVAGWCILILTAAIVLIKKMFMPAAMWHLPPCLFHKVTGLYCPGCGGTRAIIAFLHGEFVQSLRYHPLVPYAAVLGGWFMISQTVERMSGNRIKIGMHFREGYLWVAIGVIVINFLVKNILLIFGHTNLL